MPLTKTQKIMAILMIALIISETAMQAVSVWTTKDGFMMTGKSFGVSMSVALACGFMYLLYSWVITYFAPQATTKQFWAMVATLAVMVPLYTAISTQFTVIDLGAREAEQVHMTHVIEEADNTVREIIARNSEEERLILTLGPLGQNWKNRSNKENKTGHDSGTGGYGHVASTEDNIGDTILSAVSALAATKEERKTLTDSAKQKLVDLQTTISDRYSISDDEQKLRENAIAFGNTLRSLNEDLARLANLRSLDFVRAISAQLSAVQGSDRRSDSEGQTEAMRDVNSNVAATKKIVEALTERMSSTQKIKIPIFTMVSPTEAVQRYAWEVKSAWAAGYGMDYLWILFPIVFRFITPLVKRMVGEERNEQADAAEQRRQEVESAERNERLAKVRGMTRSGGA